jgi:hypothetical protein
MEGYSNWLKIPNIAIHLTSYRLRLPLAGDGGR